MADIRNMIRRHDDWLCGKPDGKRFVADGMDLTGGEFKDANLHWAIFRKCRLNGADFAGTNLSNAEMTDCSMDGADFSYSVMTGSDAKGSNLSKARLDGTILYGIKLA